jgi:cytochrome P450
VGLSAEGQERLLINRRLHWTKSLVLDTYDTYRDTRAAHRIVYDPKHGGWLVFGYDDIQQVLRNTEDFSSQRTLKPDGSVDEVLGLSILGLDPPRHRRLRMLMTHAFTHKRVAELGPRIRAITTQLLDEMQGAASPDIIAHLAIPLPAIVIAEMLGVPTEDMARFREWADGLTGDDFDLRMKTSPIMAGYIAELVAQRSRSPRPDMISDLIAARIDGDHLTPAEIIGACILLLLAGHETTATLIGNVLWCFDDFPEAQAEVVKTPPLLEPAIEEVLRFRSVIQSIPRVVMRPMRFLDQDLSAGDLIVPLFGAANRDPAYFADPDRFDIRRSPNRHIGFGFGIHLCLGATLARLEANIALGELFRRFPNVRRDHFQAVELRGSSMIYGLKRCAVQLNA